MKRKKRNSKKIAKMLNDLAVVKPEILPIEPNPVGAPPKYEPEYCQMLIDHMALGNSAESFAGIVGTCEKTITNWCNKFPEFLQAKNQGLAKSMVKWDKILNDASQGKIPNANATLIIFAMKNKFPKTYRDRTEVQQEVSGSLTLEAKKSIQDEIQTKLIADAEAAKETAEKERQRITTDE